MKPPLQGFLTFPCSTFCNSPGSQEREGSLCNLFFFFPHKNSSAYPMITSHFDNQQILQDEEVVNSTNTCCFREMRIRVSFWFLFGGRFFCLFGLAFLFICLGFSFWFGLVFLQVPVPYCNRWTQECENSSTSWELFQSTVDTHTDLLPSFLQVLQHCIILIFKKYLLSCSLQKININSSA